MAVDMVTSCLTTVIEKTPSSHPRATKLRDSAQFLLDKLKQKEPTLTASFERFIVNLVCFLNSEIESSTKRLKCMSSKKTKLWFSFHKIRTQEPLHSMWKSLLTTFAMTSDPEDPLLMCFNSLMRLDMLVDMLPSNCYENMRRKQVM